MPITSKYIFVVTMDVDPAKEALFNEVYDTEHIPLLSKVPGVRGVTRAKGESFTLSIGGAEKAIEHKAAAYVAIYEIDNPAVVTSPEWAKASEQGRWPGEVRPFTRNRSHAVYKIS